MGRGRLRGQPALVDQGLDQRVIVGDLPQRSVAQQISARVADMADRDLGAVPQQRGDRGAHALGGGIGLRDEPQRRVGIGDRRAEHGQHVDAGGVGIKRSERLDRYGTGYLASRVPAHAIGDGKQMRPGVGGVFVALTEQANVRPDHIAQGEGHLRSSRTVLPMRIGTPTCTGVGADTFCLSR